MRDDTLDVNDVVSNKNAPPKDVHEGGINVIDLVSAETTPERFSPA